MADTPAFTSVGYFPFCLPSSNQPSSVATLEDSMNVWWLLKEAFFVAQVQFTHSCATGSNLVEAPFSINCRWAKEPYIRICYSQHVDAFLDQENFVAYPFEGQGSKTFLSFSTYDTIPPLPQCEPLSPDYYAFGYFNTNGLPPENAQEYVGFSFTSKSFEVLVKGKTITLYFVLGFPSESSIAVGWSIVSASGSMELWQPG